MVMYIYAGIIAAVIVMAIIIFFVLRSSKTSNKSGKDFYSVSRSVKEGLGQKLRKLFSGRSIDETALEELEEILIRADIGPKISYEFIEKIRNENPKDIEKAISILKREISGSIEEELFILKDGKLNTILVLGVNGVGKTTSIAKIANYYLKKNKKVLLAAGDTFRAAAIEQLTKWANRLNIPVIKQKENSDPSGIVYDAIDSAKAKGVDLLIVDTAGRLHNKANLMDELKKIEKVISKKEDVEHKNMLVIDATTGQNAFQQASSFHSAINVDGIVVAKYDAQAKGGIIINIQKNLHIPFYFIGIGEKIDDIKEFNKNEYIENIFS